jgi:hypothetical protein
MSVGFMNCEASRSVPHIVLLASNCFPGASFSISLQNKQKHANKHNWLQFPTSLLQAKILTCIRVYFIQSGSWIVRLQSVPHISTDYECLWLRIVSLNPAFHNLSEGQYLFVPVFSPNLYTLKSDWKYLSWLRLTTWCTTILGLV